MIDGQPKKKSKLEQVREEFKQSKDSEHLRTTLADIGWISDDIDQFLDGEYEAVGRSLEVKQRYRDKGGREKNE